eukprot:8094096-Lingulodinium_polyedra.AAC.1
MARKTAVASIREHAATAMTGGLPGGGTDMGHLIVHGWWRERLDARSPAAILFVDAKDAFYTACAQLSTARLQCDASAARARQALQALGWPHPVAEEA